MHRNPKRDYRDELIELLTDLEAVHRAQWRFERAMLLDSLDAKRHEIARLKVQVANQRAELMRFTMHAVAGMAA
jgi:hypothetical protein